MPTRFALPFVYFIASCTLTLVNASSVFGQQEDPPLPELLRDVRTYSREAIQPEDRYRQYQFARRIQENPLGMGRGLMALYFDEATADRDRRLALRWLTEANYAAARRVALDALDRFRDDPDAQTDALDILAFAGQPGDAPLLHKLLDDTASPRTAEAALRALARIGALESAPFLQDYANRNNAPQALAAAQFIQMDRSTERISRLVEALPTNPFAKEWVESNLRIAAPELTRQLGNPTLRPLAAELLGRLRDPLTLPALKTAATQQGGEPSIEVLSAIAAFGPIYLADTPGVVNGLIRALTEMDPGDPELLRTVYDLSALTHREFGALDAARRYSQSGNPAAKRALWQAAVSFDRWWREYRANPPDRDYDDMIYRMRFMLPTVRMSGDERETAQHRHRDFLQRQPGEARRLYGAIGDRPSEDPLYLQAAMRSILNERGVQ